MAAHPVIWEFTDTTDAFEIEVRPASDPSRRARAYVISAAG